MEWSFITIIFYVLYFDSLIAIYLAFAGKQELWNKKMGSLAEQLPLTKGWVVIYHIMVLFAGYGLYLAEAISIPW